MECVSDELTIFKWADSVRSTAKYRFTSPFHYVDAEGNSHQIHCRSRVLIINNVTKMIRLITNVPLTKIATVVPLVAYVSMIKSIQAIIYPFTPTVDCKLSVCDRELYTTCCRFESPNRGTTGRAEVRHSCTSLSIPCSW